MARRCPPLPGQPWINHAGIAVPAGWFWDPPVDAQILRELLPDGIDNDGLTLLQQDGSWQHIPSVQFVAATRSAVRQTQREFS